MLLYTRFRAMFPDSHDDMDLLKELKFMQNGKQTLAADMKHKFIDFLLDSISRELSIYDSESDSKISGSSNSFSFSECEVSDDEILTESEINSDDEFSDCVSTWDNENISSLDAEKCGAQYKEEDPESSDYEFSNFEWEIV